MWQPGWEGSLGENGYTYMYGWVPLLSIWNYYNIVNQLYSNIKWKVKNKQTKTSRQAEFPEMVSCKLILTSSSHELREPQRICLQCRRLSFDPWIREIPWRREWLPTPVFLPGEFHGQRNLMGYSPWSCKKLDMTERSTLIHLKRNVLDSFLYSHRNKIGKLLRL